MSSESRSLEHDEVREYAGYWIKIMDTGAQRKGLHLPASDSTFEDPSTQCEREHAVDGDPVSKEIATFPPAHAKDRVCTDCAKSFYYSLLARGMLK